MILDDKYIGSKPPSPIGVQNLGDKDEKIKYSH